MDLKKFKEKKKSFGGETRGREKERKVQAEETATAAAPLRAKSLELSRI